MTTDTNKKQINLTTGGEWHRTMIIRFLSGVVADFYLVKLIHQNRSYVISRFFNRAQVLEQRHFMWRQNQEGLNIYIRPADPSFVLLDDLTIDYLSDLAEIKPCLLMETSPGNYQAWLKLRDMPEDRAAQTAIWRSLAAMFNADMKSAKPDQIGRLPGFYNMKPKYAPDYPLVNLHRYQDRYSSWVPDAATITAESALTPAASPQLSPPVVNKNTGTDRSGFDWAVTCDLVKKGWTDNQIRTYIEKRSLKAATRRDDYIGRTIAAARRKLRIF
jgi:hypothetical protein